MFDLSAFGKKCRACGEPFLWLTVATAEDGTEFNVWECRMGDCQEKWKEVRDRRAEQTEDRKPESP